MRATTSYDTLRARISTDSATRLIIARTDNSSTIYIAAENFALDTADKVTTSILDSEITEQINNDQDSLSFQIPNNGKTYWLVPFKHQYSSEHPWQLVAGGTGKVKCGCDGQKGANCRVYCWSFGRGITCICYGWCVSQNECSKYASSFPRDGGPFGYDNSALMISADTIVYNGVTYH